MSEKLKPCPFCGSEDYYIAVTDDPFSYDTYSTAHCSKCHATGPFVTESYLEDEPKPTRDYMETVAREKWQTRPIEDALKARIAELEEQVWNLNLENERLEEAYFVDETIAPDGTLKPSVRKLLERLEKADTDLNLSGDLIKALDNRIAELEAKFDQLTAHDATERQDDKWIPVSERLPEENKCVLVYDAGGNMTVDFLVTSGEVEKYFWLAKYRILFWMPLPESPNYTQSSTIVYGKESEE